MYRLRDNGLTIALLALFLFSLAGMLWSGWIAFNDNLSEHGAETIGLLAYLQSGDFLSALFENWESEFLQMAAYVMLTAMLFQRGSAESRDPDDPDRANDDLPTRIRQRHPVLGWLYAYSLGITLALLFLLSFALHWTSSLSAVNEEALRHGGQVHSLSTICSTRSCGSSHFRIGSQSSCRRWCWSFCRFSCGTRARRNRSQSVRPTTKQASRAGCQSALN